MAFPIPIPVEMTAIIPVPDTIAWLTAVHFSGPIFKFETL